MHAASLRWLESAHYAHYLRRPAGYQAAEHLLLLGGPTRAGVWVRGVGRLARDGSGRTIFRFWLALLTIKCPGAALLQLAHCDTPRFTRKTVAARRMQQRGARLRRTPTRVSRRMDSRSARIAVESASCGLADFVHWRARSPRRKAREQCRIHRPGERRAGDPRCAAGAAEMGRSAGDTAIGSLAPARRSVPQCLSAG
jgi:hypothetical protein